MILLTGISRTRFTASIWKKNWIFARKFRTFVLDVTTMDSRYDSSFLLHLKARCIYRCLKNIYIYIYKTVTYNNFYATMRKKIYKYLFTAKTKFKISRKQSLRLIIIQILTNANTLFSFSKLCKFL